MIDDDQDRVKMSTGKMCMFVSGLCASEAVDAMIDGQMGWVLTLAAFAALNLWSGLRPPREPRR